MSGLTNDDSVTPRKRRRANLEFNFITGSPTRVRRKVGAHAATTTATTAVTPVPETVAPISNPIIPKKVVTLTPVPSISPEPKPARQEEVPTMSTPINPNSENTNPAPIRTTNLQRQIKEQKAVGTVLNSVALVLICGVLLVTALAGMGGYVLWKQIQGQSASLAILDQNTKDRLFDLKAELVASDMDTNKTLGQSNLRLLELTTQFESYRSETSQLLAELRATNRSLERSLSLYQKKAQEQENQMAQIRRNR